MPPQPINPTKTAMVAIVSGLSAGLELSSRAVLGQAGTTGQSAAGGNGQAVHVNIATGNLVVQNQDEYLATRGPDHAVLRTYNSSGAFDGDNADQWRVGHETVRLLHGTLNAPGSSLERVDRDGSAGVYTFDAALGVYIGTGGAGAHDTITHLAPQDEFEWRDGATGITQRFEATGGGRLLSSRDPAGNALAYAYDSGGLLASVTAANGDTTFYDYQLDQLTQVRIVSGGVTISRIRYAYDAANRLECVTLDLTPSDDSIVDGKVYQTWYAYEGSSNRIAMITQSDGSSLAITYADLGGGDHRVAAIQDALGQVTRFTYGAGFATVADPLGAVTRYDFDAQGQITRIATPHGAGQAAEYLFTYSSAGDVLSVTDGEGRTVHHEYDDRGNQVLQRDAAGNTVRRSYDADNRLLSETTYLAPDPDGAGPALPMGALTVRYVHEAGTRGLLRFVIDGDGGVTEHRYNGFGERTETIAFAGARFPVVALDPLARPDEAEMQAWAGTQDASSLQRVTFAYDGRGQLQSRATHGESGFTVERFLYDQRGQLLQSVDANGGVASSVYDGLGRVLVRTNALGQAQVTQYDDAGRRTVTTTAGGLVRTHTYDAAGRLSSTVESDGLDAPLGETRYFHDAAGRVRMVCDPVGTWSSIFYDEAGRTLAEVDGNGTLVEHVYDRAGQIVQTIRRATPVDMGMLVDASGDPRLDTVLAQIRVAESAGDQAIWRQYDAAGRLLRQAEHTGSGTGAAVTENRYDGAGRLVAVVRYATTVPAAGSAGSVIPGAIPLPPSSSEDRTVRHFYDAAGRLTGTLDAEGYLTVLRYTAAGQQAERLAYATPVAQALRTAASLEQLQPPSAAEDRREFTLYDSRGRVVAQVDAERFLTETVYDNAGDPVQTIRYATRVASGLDAGTPLGALRPPASSADRTSTCSYDTLHRIVRETDPQGVETHHAYDAEGQLVSTTRAAGTSEARSQLARYDVQGRLVAELAGEGAALLTGEQSAEEVAAIWSQHGTRHAYDAGGRRVSTTDALGRKTLFFHDADGALTHTVNAAGEVEETRYDARGRVTDRIAYVRRLDPAGLQDGLTLEALRGAVAAIADASLDGHATYTYTRDSRVAASVDFAGLGTVSTYNAFGNEVSRALAGTAVNEVRTSTFDRRGLRVQERTDAGVHVVTSVVHDAFGQVTRTVSPSGQVYEQAYDRLGRVVVTRDPLDSRRSTSYDAFDRVLTQTDALGNVTRYAYEAAARVLRVTTPEGIVTTTTYDRHGQVHSILDAEGYTTTYRYDRSGRLVETVTPLTTTSRQYDAAGQLGETIDANGVRVAYGYDAAGRVLTRHVDPGGLDLVTAYAYDGRGHRVSVTDANGVVTRTEYDPGGRLVTQTVDPDGLALRTSYAHDARGNALSVHSPGGSVTEYHYDGLGRRVQERVDPDGLDLRRGWAYDLAGNVVTASDALGGITCYVYDAANRLVYTVDPAGGVRKNVHDAEGRVVQTVGYAVAIAADALPPEPTLASVASLVESNPGQDEVEHRVLVADGRLLATVDGLGAVVRYTYDARGLVTERIAHATRADLSEWIPGEIPAVTADAARDVRVSTVHDAIGRPTHTVDGTGAVVAYKYDGEGRVLERTAFARRIPLDVPRTAEAIESALSGVEQPGQDARTRRVYDAGGRLAWSVDGTGAATHYVYDGNGNVVREIRYATSLPGGAQPEDAVPSAADRITSFAYDGANRRILEVNAVGAVTERVFDEDGRVAREVAYARLLPQLPQESAGADIIRGMLVADPEQDRSSWYGYDAAGRQVLAIRPDGAAVESEFGPQGHVVARTAYAALVDIGALAAGASLDSLRALVVAGSGDRTTRFFHDAAGRRVLEVDALGGVTRFSHDALGRVLEERRYAAPLVLSAGAQLADVAAAVAAGAGDRFEAHTYDAAGNRLSSRDALGGTESWSHDALGRQLRFVNKKGAEWNYAHDAAGRLVREDSPAVSLASVVADAAGQITAGGPEVARITTLLAYDALGNLVQRTEAAGRPEERSTRYEYDAAGRQVRVLLPTVMVYDATTDDLTSNSGAVGRKEAARTLETRTFYNAFGEAVANRDVGGRLSQKVYDGAGRLLYDIDAAGFVTSHGYGAFRKATRLTRHASPTSLAQRDPASVPLELAAAEVESALSQGPPQTLDRTLHTTHDRLGRVVETRQPEAFTLDNTLEMKSFWGAARTRQAYDAFGDLVQVSRARNHTGLAWYSTNHYFDALGREQATVDAMGYLTTRAYDRFGDIVEVKEYAQALADGAWSLPTHGQPADSAEDRLTRHGYDLLGRKTSETRVQVEYSVAPDGASVRGDLTTRFSYDAVGNQTAVTDALGQTTWTYHDALGRVRAIAAPFEADGVQTLTVFQRDAHGNALVKVEHAMPVVMPDGVEPVPVADPGDSTTVTQFDVLGRSVAVRDANGKMAFTSYDAAGNVAKTWRTVSGQTVFQVNMYDAVGRLTGTLTPASTTVLQGGITARYEPPLHPFAPGDDGKSKLTLEWSNLVDVAAGDVRVSVDYLAKAGVTLLDGQATYRAASAENVTKRLLATDAAGGSLLTWDTPADSILHIRVTQLSDGQWKTLWEGPLSKARGSGMNTVSQAVAGLAHVRQQFNGFGEMTSREVVGAGGEYFDYDTAGRLWRTNSGDGVDKVFLHDLHGNVTAEIRSEGSGGADDSLLNLPSAAAAHNAPDTRRVDLQHNALGHTVSRTESRRARADGSVSEHQQFLTATIVQSGQASAVAVDGPAVPRFNEVKLTWQDLRALGPGDLTVLVEYRTPLTRHGGGVDEYGTTIPITYTGGAVRSYRSSLLVGDWHPKGDVLRWEETSTDPDASGVEQVLRVRLMKKDVDGTLRTLFDQAPGYGPHEIRIAAPADPQTKVRLLSRLAGTTAWTEVSGLRDFGTTLRYDATGLGVGTHEYRVEALRPGETAYSPIASGQLKLSMPALATISTPITFGQAYLGAAAFPRHVPGALSWAHQDFAVQQVLRYRVAGSNNAWSTLPIQLFNGSQRDGVDCSGLASGNYEFELLWTAPGQGVPTSHATGIFKVIPPQPSVWVPPVGLPKVPGVVLSSMTVFGGGYSEATAERSVPALAWQACGADVARYLRNGQWVYLTINNQYAYSSSPEAGTGIQRASLEALGVGTHTIEVRRMAGSNDLLTKLRYVVSSNGTRTMTDITPAYKPGYWTAAIPTTYGVTVSTKAGSAAISTTQGLRMTVPDGQWEAGPQWQRPVVNQNTDRWGNVVVISDPRSPNWVTTYRFNWNNQLVQQALPGSTSGAAGPVSQIYFDALGRQVAVRDANGNVNGQTFDAAGNLREEIHADGGVVRHTYDALGRRESTVDAMGNTVTFGHDAMGNQLWIDKGALYVYKYDGAQLLSKTVENVVERWTYDELGQRLTHQNGNGERLTYVYDLRGNVVETKQPLGQKTRSAFDAMGRKTAEVDANAIAATWTYDYFGRVTAHTDLGGARYAYTYDNAAQLIRQTNSRGQDLTYKYDVAGQLASVVDGALEQTTTYLYDEAGRRVRERVVQQGITYQDNHLAYDERGNLRDVSDARVHLTIDYDLAGNRTKVRTQVGYIGETGSAQNRDMSRYFLYDAMNRQVAAEAVDATGKIDEGGGHLITYDKNGNRTSDTSYRLTTKLGSSVISGYRADGSAIYEGSTTYQTGVFSSKEVYRYDAANRLQSVVRDGVQVEHRHYDGADRLVHSGPVALPRGYLAAARTGLAAGQSDGLDRTYNYYDANGRILKQVILEGDGGDRAEVSWNPDASYAGLAPNGYDGVGNAKGYVVWDKDGNVVTEYTTSFERFEGHQAGVVTARRSGSPMGTTTHDYDANGFLVGISDSTMGANNRVFINDTAGKALYVKQAGNVQRQLIVNGEVLGMYGVGIDEDRPKDGGGNPNFENIVDFGFGYAPITSTYPNPAPGAYVVRAGDTLQGIAQGAYGDSALWYRIAEANGLSSSNDLKVGQTLNVPNRVATIHNNESTFKPYDPSRITGDTTPNLPMPDAGRCGGAGQLLMVVVAVVVAVYTAGAAAPAFGGAVTVAPGVTATTWGTGLATLAGGSAAGITVTGAGSIAAAAAVGGAAGSVASQLVGKAVGAVDGFSWKSVAMSAVSAGATAGIGAYAGAAKGFLGGSSLPAVAGRAIVSNVLTQGVGVALGLQKRFDWRGVAASGVGAAVGQAMHNAAGEHLLTGTVEGLAKAAVIGLVAGVAAAAARGGRVVVQQIATDAFGNALGQSLASVSSGVPTAQAGDPLGEFVDKNMPAWEQRQANFDQIVGAFSSPKQISMVEDDFVAAGDRFTMGKRITVTEQGRTAVIDADDLSGLSDAELMNRAKASVEEAGSAGRSAGGGSREWNASILYQQGLGDIREFTSAAVPPISPVDPFFSPDVAPSEGLGAYPGQLASTPTPPWADINAGMAANKDSLKDFIVDKKLGSLTYVAAELFVPGGLFEAGLMIASPAVGKAIGAGVAQLNRLPVVGSTLPQLGRSVLGRFGQNLFPPSIGASSPLSQFRAINTSNMTRADKGVLAENRGAFTYRRAGYQQMDARLPSNHGFDGVFVKRGADGNVRDIIINESKYSSTGRASLANTSMGRQMSPSWINENIQKMMNSADPAVMETGFFLDANRAMIRAKANVLDPWGNNRWNVVQLPR